ncbi:MAG TPA: AbrB/MazE/SpoVT family DNA-binding domain-containing protein [Acidimicrobiales bacterium]
MKDTGLSRKVDDLGRIVLPVELRRLYGIQPGDALEISVEGDAIILRKLAPGCVFCGSPHRLRDFKGRVLCAECADDLSGVGAASS